MYAFDDLMKIMAKLRSDDGCPWDRKQTFESLKTCLKDETEEVFQAVDSQDMENLCEELGDVLMLIAMYGQIASEDHLFTIQDVIQGVCEKMIRRHPHVFGNIRAKSPEESLNLWNEIKRQEKEEKAAQKSKENSKKP